MRDAIDVLRREAMDSWNPSSKTDQEYSRDIDRAADLLEALSNPPETVEELRERASGMVETAIDFIQYADDQIQVIVLDNDDCLLWTAELPTPRAAWFAIVGMMEVGR